MLNKIINLEEINRQKLIYFLLLASILHTLYAGLLFLAFNADLHIEQRNLRKYIFVFDCLIPFLILGMSLIMKKIKLSVNKKVIWFIIGIISYWLFFNLYSFSKLLTIYNFTDSLYFILLFSTFLLGFSYKNIIKINEKQRTFIFIIFFLTLLLEDFFYFVEIHRIIFLSIVVLLKKWHAVFIFILGILDFNLLNLHLTRSDLIFLFVGFLVKINMRHRLVFITCAALFVTVIVNVDSGKLPKYLSRNMVEGISLIKGDRIENWKSTYSRILETNIVIESVTKDLTTILFGRGFGSTYEIGVISDKSITETSLTPGRIHNIHILPVALLGRFGLFGLIIFFIWFLFLLKNYFLHTSGRFSKSLFIVILSILSYAFINSAFFFTNGILFFIMGNYYGLSKDDLFRRHSLV